LFLETLPARGTRGKPRSCVEKKYGGVCRQQSPNAFGGYSDEIPSANTE
jgi:hypothetical protein